MTKLSLASLLGALLIASAGGCSMFGSKASDNSPPAARGALEVPPDLARPAGDDLAASSPTGAATYSETTAKANPAAANATSAAPSNVQLMRDGGLRWLVVTEDPAHLWARTRDYFLRNNMKLVVEDSKNGLLETDWMDRPVQTSGFFSSLLGRLRSTGLRDKFRVRIETGRVSGTSELYVSHQGQEEVVASGGGTEAIQTAWQMRPSDPAMEAEMLGKLMTALGASDQQARNQIAAANAPQAQITKGALFLPQDDLDNAWRRVGQALDRYGIVVEDSDRSVGTYYIRYHDKSSQQKSGGLFSFLGDDSGDSTKDASKDRFQIHLATTATGTSVTLLDVEGKPVESKTGENLLNILYQQLR